MYQKIRPKLFPKFNCQTWLLVLLLLFASRVPYFCLSWILVILRLPEIIGSIEKTKSLIWNLLAKCFSLKNLSWLAVDWIFVSTERLTCWNPNLNVLGGGALGKWFGHEDGALVSGICAPIKEATESSLASSTMRGHDEETASVNQEVASLQTQKLLATWSWTYQSQEVWEINFGFMCATQSVVFFSNSVKGLNRNWYLEVGMLL